MKNTKDLRIIIGGGLAGIVIGVLIVVTESLKGREVVVILK